MNTPGVLEPMYFSSTETKAQLNRLMQLSVWDFTEKKVAAA
jgi:hypothetical protein